MKRLTKLALLATAALGTTAAHAQSITYLTLRGNSVYQVIPGSNTGGRYVNSPRAAAGFYCAGYTDRVSRGESYATVVTPTANCGACDIGYFVNGRFRANTGYTGLPWWTAGWVSLNPNDDNIEWYAGGVSLRLPIGTR